MDKYSDVIKQFKRMCWYYSRDKMQKNCPMCTSYPNCNIGQCRKIAFEKPAHFAATVMRWAAEHPVVYPTWEEWLVTNGIMELDNVRLNGDYRFYHNGKPVYTIPSPKMFSQIPADIAEKLGIEPKEADV